MTQTLPLLQEGLWDAFIALLFMDKLIHAVSSSDSDLNYPFATIPFQARRELVSISFIFIIDTCSCYTAQTVHETHEPPATASQKPGNDPPGVASHMLGLQPSATMTSSIFSTEPSPWPLYCRDHREHGIWNRKNIEKVTVLFF